MTLRGVSDREQKVASVASKPASSNSISRPGSRTSSGQLEVAAMAIDHPPIQRPLGYLVHRNHTLSNAARAMLALLDAAREEAALRWPLLEEND